MNPFTTEHPMNSQPSWLDAKEHPVRALAGRVLVGALGLTPFVLAGLYYWVIEAEDGMTTPKPLTVAGLWRFLLVGGAFALGCSVVLSVLTALGWWLVKRPWRWGSVPASCQE